jgi:tight adherence protein B
MRTRTSTRSSRRSLHRAGAGAVLALVLGPFLAAPAQAAETTIEHSEKDGELLQVVVSVADARDDVSDQVGTVTATFGGEPVTATAQPLSDSGETVQRTAVLAMDVSNSMAGDRFEAAKAAANVFLDTVPSDISVGLVTFAADVTVEQEPTQDREVLRAAIDELELSRRTRLYDGVAAAVQSAGSDGVRSVLVLSDGADFGSTTSLAKVGRAVEASEVKVNVVALAQKSAARAKLQTIADAGHGTVLAADDPEALAAVFADEAEALAQQVLVSVAPPAELAGDEGTLALTMQVDGEPVTDEAFVVLPAVEQQTVGGGEVTAAATPAESGLEIPRELMFGGLGAATLAVLFIVVLAAGGAGEHKKQDAVDRSIEAYTRQGARKIAAANRENQPQGMTASAVAVAENVLDSQKGLEAALGGRLEAAGLALKPAEWLLLHLGVAIGLGIFGLLLGGGSVVFMLVGIVLGLLLPWFFLSFKRRSRIKAFNAQLADTLQLMAGSLSAGLSLAQSVDTVVREGTDPMAGEFRRAIIEARLGVEIEDALNGIADRMNSVDFEWVVMAIRIQRSVGGNLSELLNKVADTIREREYLERQVKALSAEGRLSVWILGGLPPGFMAYLGMANPSYLEPLFRSPLGWAMLILMSIMLTAGIFWMKKVVKVEV